MPKPVNIKIIDDKKREKIAVVNFKAALSKIRIISQTVDSVSWERIIIELKTLNELGCIVGADCDTILSRIPAKLPDTILRRDRGLWDSSIYFLTGEDIFFLSMVGNGPVQLYAQIDGKRLKSDSFQKSPQVDQVFQRLGEAVRAGRAGMIGNKTYLGLWVARGYDTMQRVAQIRQLRQEFGADFSPAMAISQTGNLLPVETAFPFVSEVEKVADEKSWRRALPVEIGLAENLKAEWPRLNDFHQEIMSFLRSFATERPKSRAHEFILFISIEAEKRQMENQEEFFDTLISHLESYITNIRVLVNGMTGNIEGVDFFEDIRDFETKIIKRLSKRHPKVVFEHLHAKMFLDKARVISSADFFVAPLGTAALIPQVMNIPGVVYNSLEMVQNIKWFLDLMPSRAVLLPVELASTIQEDMAIRKYDWGWKDNTRHSYRLDVPRAIDFCISQISHSSCRPRRKFRIWNDLLSWCFMTGWFKRPR